MSKKTIDALRRSDRAVIGALLLALAIATGATAAVPYTDSMPGNSRSAAAQVTHMPAAKPAPSEIAMAQLLAERRCLAQAMYYEARSEGIVGQKAVAEVVFHRMRNRNYPSTICGVVFEGSELKRSCQFSFTCNGDMKKPKNARAWAEARLLAAKIITGTVRLGDITDDATSYHAVYVDPVWAGHLVKTVQIGNHIFYRLPSARGRSS
jgi:spore germination cell wall hydrolase CwlJ-like protein